MITLEIEHYNGHVKDHPKDAEFLNCPLMNYLQMQNIFGSGVATGRFAMGSSEPLGTPAEQETIDLDGEAPPPVLPTQNGEGSGSNAKGEQQGLGKRKRVVLDDEVAFFIGLTDAINGFAKAVMDTNTPKAAPGIYSAVMGCPNFSREALMFCLNYMMKEKETAMGFLDMEPDDRELWLRDHLGRNNFYG
ncbi:hypothetical protein HU200_037176 [Digitaria exilis]|uniref:Uncharacterized protein n=1 Tax=Digitaria exilis TaxID=1010633 RepID=A0A835EHR4_9POAL|nr:hypothetical protein HU200_037176 [Digitaria exilis]